MNSETVEVARVGERRRMKFPKRLGGCVLVAVGGLCLALYGLTWTFPKLPPPSREIPVDDGIKSDPSCPYLLDVIYNNQFDSLEFEDRVSRELGKPVVKLRDLRVRCSNIDIYKFFASKKNVSYIEYKRSEHRNIFRRELRFFRYNDKSRSVLCIVDMSGIGISIPTLSRVTIDEDDDGYLIWAYSRAVPSFWSCDS